MARIWCVGMLLALTAAAGLGRWSQTAEAILMAGGQAVRLGVTLTGSMILWGGLMEMLHDTAVLGWVSGGVRRLLKPLVRRELSEESWVAMGMNLTANLFGLEDEVGEVLKHGTLSIGFIGLAEALKALRGAHHGESEESQNLGLEIIGFMRKYVDKLSEERKLNYTLLATPAEGLSGRFVRLDREKFGVIPGVTDREYYTNSFHVPVYYPCSAFHKISVEAPYHELTNAGHISYVEMDGDPLQNLDAFEKIVRFMHDKGIGYGSINHPVDRDPVCGYNGIIGDECPNCHRREDGRPFERIRRITGYLVGTLDRFNNAKRAEEHDRVKHGVSGTEA